MEWVLLAIVVAVVLYAIVVYNGLVSLRQRVTQAFADIDVQLKQRHDLIPNLVETVKGYAGHERATLEAVVHARNAALTASGLDFVTGSHNLSREENPRLYNLLENLCISRGVPMPRLRIMETGRLNAFATGLTEKQHAITVTRGLIENLDDAEMEAVLAHELTHIRNEDVRMMVTAVIIAGVISFFGELVFRWLDIFPRWGRSSSNSSSRSDRKGGGGAFLAILIALVMIAIAWALSLVIRFALSRSREYLADAGSVELAKNPDAMISALTKISGRGELEGVPSGLMEMCVDNPRSGFADLFAGHPPIEERIEALVRYAGGRRPLPPPEPETSEHSPANPWGPANPPAPA